MSRLKVGINHGIMGEGKIEASWLLPKAGWLEQDFSPFMMSESFESPIEVKIIKQTNAEFVTEFIMGSTLYTFKGADLDTSTIDLSFQANGDVNVVNLGTDKYLGYLGSGIFRSIEKMFDLYDGSKGNELNFMTPKKVGTLGGKIIDNPLIKFYDSKYLQKIIYMKMGAKFKKRSSTHSFVIGEYDFSEKTLG